VVRWEIGSIGHGPASLYTSLTLCIDCNRSLVA
jgi:hypothetical protein